jgi:hypothetical protein
MTNTIFCSVLFEVKDETLFAEIKAKFQEKVKASGGNI